MPTALSVTAPLLLAAVLVVSAIGKLRAPERAHDAFTAMGVPSWLNRPVVVRAHPWAEIALAAMLLTVPGPLGVVVTGAALLLMLVYLALVVRASRSPVDVDCACFGSLGSDRVTAVTVWRNVWLSTLAGVALWGSLEGRPTVARLGGLGAGEWWWLVAEASVGITLALVLHADPPARSETAGNEPAWGEDDDEADYVRSRTPAIPVVLGDGSLTNLRALSARRAQLLVFVSETCGACRDIIRAVPDWRSTMPMLDVRLVLRAAPDQSKLTSVAEPASIHDANGWLHQSFDTSMTPSAVLLGADGMLAGGPVSGSAAVSNFATEIAAQLQATG